MSVITAVRPLRVAILDLYDNEPNQGMRAMRELLAAADGRFYDTPVAFDVFETRYKADAPGLDYDVYLSSGGPGSPFDGEGTAWERRYFDWLDAVWNHNARGGTDRKHVLFICHSFQMMNRFFGTAEVTRRRSESFGIYEVNPTDEGLRDPLFAGLDDPFYAADFRKWQVVQPDAARLAELGATVLCLEKERPHVPLERAVMGLRISPELVGVQFHPEADPPGMMVHFQQPHRRALIVEEHGQEKYDQMIARMQDADFLTRTYDAVIPNFLRSAIEDLRDFRF